MRTVILFGTLFITLTYCSSHKHTTDNQKMQIVTANYSKWSQSPLQRSDIPEKGIDVAVKIKNWPDDTDPVHIIYQSWTSFKPKIAKQDSNVTIMQARIVKTSSVLQQTSAETSKADALLYKDKDGNKKMMEITNWVRQQ